MMHRREDRIAYTESFLDPYAPISQHEHRLPHWQQGSVFYFVTWRLADSLPQGNLIAFIEAKNLWLKNHPRRLSAQEQTEYRERFSDKVDDWLDAGHGSCVLADPILARCVADALLHFDQVRYSMDTFAIVPNHVHALFRIIGRHRLEDIVKSWKGFSAREINRRLKRGGALWQGDYWDRMIRNEEHLVTWRRYIRGNPPKARLQADQVVLYEHESEGGFSNPP